MCLKDRRHPSPRKIVLAAIEHKRNEGGECHNTPSGFMAAVPGGMLVFA